MPKAIEVAEELRRIADGLAAHPETEVQTAWLYFHCDTKALFLSTFSALLRPLTKHYDADSAWARVRLEHKTPAVELECSVLRANVCEIVEPAKPAVYRCEPLLSDEEESTLTSAE